MGHPLKVLLLLLLLMLPSQVVVVAVRGHARPAGAPPLGATRPGDFIIAGVFPIHQDVERDIAVFQPQPQKCVT